MSLAIVTGGGRGLGAAMCRRLAKDGFHVLIGHRHTSDAEALVDTIRSSGGRADLLPLDVRSPDAVKEAFLQVDERDTPLGVLVNNAGVNRDGWMAMSSEADWAEVLEVNVQGTARCSRAAARLMMRRRAGVILNIGSVAGLRASAGQACYATSKAALTGLTQSLASEWGRYGIRVNTVAAGFIDVGMTKRVPPDLVRSRLEHIPMKRLGRAEEVSSAVAFLCSEAASYITGAVLPVDGGLSA